MFLMRFWPGRHPAPCALACIALFGLLLRLRGLNHSMSPDEAGMFDYLIRIGLRVIVFGPYPSGNHVLNTLCTWLAYSLFGLHDWAFQLPSLLFGMGGILLAYPVGTALFGSSKAGLAGALFLACAPYHVAYSANSRGYTAVIFFALLSALAFIAGQGGAARKFLIRSWRSCGYLYQIPRSLAGKI